MDDNSSYPQQKGRGRGRLNQQHHIHNNHHNNQQQHQQQIYKPGNGPLKKSTYDQSGNTSNQQIIDVDEYHSLPIDLTITTKVDQQSTDNNNSPSRRVNKKPEQQFYVPKQKQRNNTSMESLSVIDTSGGGGVSPTPSNHQYHQHDRRGGGGGNNDKMKNNNRNNFNRKNNNQNQKNNSYPQQNYHHHPREIRQESEPRITTHSMSGSGGNSGGVQYTGVTDRPRDCRSVEPNYNNVRQPKPPSGRRNSITSEKGFRLPSNIQSLPPRLQKKMLEQFDLPLNLLEDCNQQTEMDNTDRGGGGGGYNNYSRGEWFESLLNISIKGGK